MNSMTSLAMAAALLAGPALADDKATIQALDDQFSAAINKGDTAQVSAMYALDAIVLPPGAAPIHKAGIKAFLDGMAKDAGHFELHALQVDRLSPDYLREVGTYTLQTRAEPPGTQTATYVVIWKRVGGQWKLWTDIFH